MGKTNRGFIFCGSKGVDREHLPTVVELRYLDPDAGYGLFLVSMTLVRKKRGTTITVVTLKETPLVSVRVFLRASVEEWWTLNE